MRVKTGPSRHRRHKKIQELASGYWMSRHHLHRSASDAVLHAGNYAFEGRKNRRRDLRRLWITRLSAALTDSNLSYSRFIESLKKANIELDRKILADLAFNDPDSFKAILQKIKSS